MSNHELERLQSTLAQARYPRDVFGTLTGSRTEQIETARRIFRQMAKLAHPDIHAGSEGFATADQAFKRLLHFWELAQQQLENGTYASPDVFEPFVLRMPDHVYSIEHPLAQGDICQLYLGSYTMTGRKEPAIFKFPLHPEDNDLLANEARILSHLSLGYDYINLRHFVSQLLDTFMYQEEASGAVRQLNVLTATQGLYSLQEVKEAYPLGIDPKDMAWIWRRLLVALGFAHRNNVIHGAVLPTHVLLHPEQHGLVLIDWSYAVLDVSNTGERISAISIPYRDWYPAEVPAREMPTPALDIAMGARCMIDILGGDPHTGAVPDTVPWQIRDYLKACILPHPMQRPQEVDSLLLDFDTLIERLWGPRTFHTFRMPER
ncbi:hypothetical protein [Dictyobacter arantiisoli]|uniref:Protein kinase domain-containing protein n=1 Tax=Dictyobacter arantiisoli TaxID=2014874 RepID=A0A5A5TGT8_9CHLR|nr:hypothetical protein [Dictyobacter arantiisoli]GCF10790.1 hypothetical protein KDI_43540 [Dictyobacter arantiisoli]